LEDGWSYDHDHFRRVYRPDGSLTAGLLEGRFTKEPA
jgi:hypothetical protein